MNASIGDLIGGMADRIMQDMLAIGDVHMVPLTEQNGITPAQGEKLRNKFFVVLGFDNQDNVIGGVVINSRLNLNLPAVITDYMVLTIHSLIMTRSSIARHSLWQDAICLVPNPIVAKCLKKWLN